MFQFLIAQNELILTIIDTFITPRDFNNPKTLFVHETLKFFKPNKFEPFYEHFIRLQKITM